jgi:hypothetical protein
MCLAGQYLSGCGGVSAGTCASCPSGSYGALSGKLGPLCRRLYVAFDFSAIQGSAASFAVIFTTEKALESSCCMSQDRFAEPAIYVMKHLSLWFVPVGNFAKQRNVLILGQNSQSLVFMCIQTLPQKNKQSFMKKFT